MPRHDPLSDEQIETRSVLMRLYHSHFVGDVCYPAHLVNGHAPDLVKAGWIEAHGGGWRITDAGITAWAQMNEKSLGHKWAGQTLLFKELREHLGKGRSDMKVITLLNEKGGVGKTTLATHIAAGLAIRGWRVVLADADPQGQASTLMGLEKEAGFYNLLVREADFPDVLRFVKPDVYSAEAVEGELYILPGNIETRVIPHVNPNPFIIRSRLEELKGWADVVVFDTSPTPSIIHTAIYMATDSILLPTTPAFLGMDGIAASITHQDNVQAMRAKEGIDDMMRLGVIPTMFRLGTIAHDVAMQQLVKAFKRNLWPAIPQRTVFEAAALKGQLLFKYAPDDETTVDVLGGLISRVELGIGLKQHDFA